MMIYQDKEVKGSVEWLSGCIQVLTLMIIRLDIMLLGYGLTKMIGKANTGQQTFVECFSYSAR